MKIFLNYLFVVVVVLLYSCRTAKFPVCTKLSDTKPSSIEGVSTTLLRVCNEHHISITVLSSTIIELRGSIKQMKWLQENYHILMCDFDQSEVSLDESTFTSCMSNAKDWIKIVQSNRPDTLMIDQTKFCANCCK